MSEFSSQQYLARVGLNAAPEASVDGLRAIHQAQHRSIPFENFDVALGRGIDLSAETLMDKLVHSKRGGYCFELNGLLLMALTQYSFDVRPLLGRVHLSGEPTGRGHFMLLVTLEGKQWIVDAGFGSQTPRAPLPLEYNTEFTFDFQTLRLMESELYGVMMQAKVEGEWVDLYSFDFMHVCEGDIKYGNHYTATHPESTFKSMRIAVLANADGVVTLLDHTLRIRVGDSVTEKQLDKENYISALKQYFGIELDAPYEALSSLGE